MAITDSGSSKGAGEAASGRTRPRKPSGEDCTEFARGLADVGMVEPEAGVTASGTEVLT